MKIGEIKNQRYVDSFSHQKAYVAREAYENESLLMNNFLPKGFTSKTVKLGNGEKFEVYTPQGELAREVSLTCDRFAWDVWVFDYHTNYKNRYGTHQIKD